MTDENEGLLVGRITIERRMTADDVTDWVTTEDGDGDPLGIAEALGMMRLGEHTLLREQYEEED